MVMGLERNDEAMARLVEINPKELAGRKVNEYGQIWNDGRVCRQTQTDLT